MKFEINCDHRLIVDCGAVATKGALTLPRKLQRITYEQGVCRFY